MKKTSGSTTKKILVIDVGGTNLKIHATGAGPTVKVKSGPTMTAAQMVVAVKKVAAAWTFEAVSIGYPGPVVKGRPAREPHNLGGGWIKFDFAKAFGRPVKIINDAAMQALGGHRGGRSLFLGLGTGLGSALVVGREVLPLELAHLPFKKNRTYEEYLGTLGLEHSGKKKWVKHVAEVVGLLKAALLADYVVLGGGNARLLKKLPPQVELGKNANAITGGVRLWSEP
jgi:polyphosphate glucokinase